MVKNSSVDRYILKHEKWQEELIALRNILESTELTETIKWGAPVYTINGKNVVGMSAFKNHFGLWFFNGALLSDRQNKLFNAQEGKTLAMRQLRFKSFDDIDEKVILSYLHEAIGNQKTGKEIKPQKKPLVIPELLIIAMNQNDRLSDCFENLSLSCKREYSEYINEAKKEETKLNRLNKIIPMILSKKGLNDKYKNS